MAPLSEPPTEPPTPSPVPPLEVVTDAMQLGQTSLSHSKRQRRITAGVSVLLSTRPFHSCVSGLAKRLSSSANAGVLASGASSCFSPARLTLPGTLLWGHDSFSLSFLIDSGADDTFNDQALVTQVNIPTEVLSKPKNILGLNGEILAKITSNHSPNPHHLRTDSALYFSCFRPHWRALCTLVSRP